MPFKNRLWPNKQHYFLMLFLRKYFFTSLLLFFTVTLSAQQSLVDSLLSVLETAKEDTNKVNILYELSEVCDEADILKYAQQSLALAEKLNYKKGMANAYNNVGFVYDSQGQSQKGLEYYMKSLQLHEELKNKEGIAATLTNVGSIYNYQGQIEKSLEYNIRALMIYKEIHNKGGMGSALNNIGTLYNNLGQEEKALDFFLQALEIQEDVGNKSGVATCLHNIGTNYSAQGKLEMALEYYLKALEIRKSMNSQQGYATCLNSISVVYLRQKNYAKAEDYCERALQLATSIGFAPVVTLARQNLSQISAAQGKYKKAFEMHVLFKLMADSIRNQETQKASLKRQIQYEFEKKEMSALAEQEKKDALVWEESQQQKIVLWSVLSGLALVVVFAGFVLNRWRVTRKQKKIIETQKVMVEQKNESITDSIDYALRIQNAIFPKKEVIRTLFSDYFIFFKPKDVVSGDFYWAERRRDKVIFAVGDCTGHGVPGAFMSMIGNALLNEIVNEQEIDDADEILNHLKNGVIHALKQSGDADAHQDGMEMGLCILDKKINTLYFSGAYNSLYHFSNGKFTEYDGDKQAVGYEQGKESPFTKHTISVSENDSIYLFTDGFADQKGEVSKRKFYSKPFRELIKSIHHLPMAEQEEIINKTFNDWKGNLEQIDDILVLGIRI